METLRCRDCDWCRPAAPFVKGDGYICVRLRKRIPARKRDRPACAFMSDVGYRLRRAAKA